MSFFNMIRTCNACGTKNRVPAKHLAQAGRCGSCKTALPPLSEPLEVDSISFAEIVQSVSTPVLVDFWASWCGPCRQIAPEVHKLAEEMAGRAVVVKVNTEEQQQLASEFQIQSIPTFMVLKNGQVVFRQSGTSGRSEMRRWLENA